MQVVLDFFQGDAEFEAMVEPLKDWLNRLRAALAPFRTTEGGQA
jgi:hypothetical protein